MEQRLTMIGLGVRDVAVAREFYSGVLGWTPSNDMGHIVFYDLGGYFLSLYGEEALAEDAALPFERPLPAFRGMTLAYNTNSPAEVDAVFETLRAAGAEILKPPQEVFWGGYSGYFRDPDGYAWEVAHNPGWTIGSDGRARPAEGTASGDP
ncbi:VOC family protein [Tropicimonas marinistellae]|uniref:VOC family protein n=1 Tax=Tropicimonas marinistellae TaxID=1739787 RepID=UPI0008338716|nr:VOC family protein [Tropicimonas marinistellae]